VGLERGFHRHRSPRSASHGDLEKAGAGIALDRGLPVTGRDHLLLCALHGPGHRVGIFLVFLHIAVAGTWLRYGIIEIAFLHAASLGLRRYRRHAGRRAYHLRVYRGFPQARIHFRRLGMSQRGNKNTKEKHNYVCGSNETIQDNLPWTRVVLCGRLILVLLVLYIK